MNGIHTVEEPFDVALEHVSYLLRGAADCQ